MSDLYECQGNVWTYHGTFDSAGKARTQALNDGYTTAQEGTCTDPPKPGGYTICATPNSVNGTSCMPKTH
jgi:hypothetical protein